MDTITGTIERITFFNEENGYTILKMTPDVKPPATAAVFPYALLSPLSINLAIWKTRCKGIPAGE
jgi:hypothetical protein